MNREEAPGKSPEDMYIQQKVRVLLMLKKMGSNVRTVSLLEHTMITWHFISAIDIFLKNKHFIFSTAFVLLMHTVVSDDIILKPMKLCHQQ